MRAVQILKCILSPGGILFLPVSCWHYVEGLEVSIAVLAINFQRATCLCEDDRLSDLIELSLRNDAVRRDIKHVQRIEHLPFEEQETSMADRTRIA